jgi:L-lactate dehydrogenase complex protein LldF
VGEGQGKKIKPKKISTFPKLMGESLSHPAVRAATHRALETRERLLQTYPQWQEWRSQARAVKAAVLARLDAYLARLQEQVEAWGGKVLWARDAGEARSLILQVAREHRVKVVVKSKSMTTEEIALNPHLAAAGLKVRETDLGEFIIQLAGHAPAHLTAPALHLDRHQIAAIFKEHLDDSGPAEPEALTRRAREILRPSFYEAQMGITGVNFAAAAEGALVMVENESNLRLTANVPQVHLALMGLEKVIPSLAEVEVFLRLLPASATGQRLTALVHFIRGLKPHVLGRQAFYLVILDNGRRRLLAEAELKEALHCLRCGACLNACPVFQEGAAHLYGRVYPGAIGILLAPYLAPVGDISDLCTQCRACQEICPAAIPLAEKIIQVRRFSPKFRRARALSRLAGLWLRWPRLYRGSEGILRLLPQKSPLAIKLAPESFYKMQMEGKGQGPGGPGFQSGQAPAPSPKPPPPTPDEGGVEERQGGGEPPAPTIPDPPPTLASRLREVGSSLQEIRGPAALAQYLAAQATTGTLWLEEHTWLRQAAPELEKLGVETAFGGRSWAPDADTVVTVALGAIYETGSVIMPGGGGPATWLPFRARRQIVLVPGDKAGLSLAEGLEMSGKEKTGLITWLTGPSRTTDIEKVLVLGAQGPEQLEVVVYQPD